MKKIIRHSLFFLAVLFLGCTAQSAHADAVHNQGFLLNKGQWPDSILSRASFAFGDVFLLKDGIVFSLRDRNSLHQHQSTNIHGHDSTSILRGHVYKMKFRNATLRSPQGFNASEFHVNFIKGDDPSQWAGKLFCYKKLIIEDIYPSINLVLYVTNGGLKYDLLLKNNADPKQIIIDYEGTDGLFLDAQGNLQINTSLGNITEKMPIAFVEKNNQSKEPVICRYLLTGNTVRFNIRNLTKAREEKLVIDPELIFATYSGSTADNWGNSATYDESGCLYAAGIVFGDGQFPATLGAYQTSFQSPFFGQPDVAIMKYSAIGDLIYATYLGGALTEVPTSTIVNSSNELYILGTTSSSGITYTPAFPTTAGAYDRTFNGGSTIYPLGRDEGIQYYNGSDLFIAKLSADGSSLLASTLIGGSGNDGLMLDTELLSRNYGDQLRSEILLDSLGDVYIASHTQSNDILNTARPGYDLTYHGGGRDGIVMKLKKDLSDIVWNTYWGGNGLDACYSLQFGINHDIYITGGTNSTNLPADGIKTSNSGGIDGFILRLSDDGTTMMNSTYIGTNATDQSYLIQTDHEGGVYVLGQTKGIYPKVNAAYSNVGSQQFIHKLNNQLNTTIFSTPIGSGEGKTDFVPTAFLVNDCENIFVCGWGGSVNYPFDLSVHNGPYYQGGTTYDLPTTPNAFQLTTDLQGDFYLMVLKKDAEKILYGTYFGGKSEREHVDGGTSRFDKRGIVYEAVCGGCGGTSFFPVTPKAYSPTNNSTNCNNAVFKFDLSSLNADFTADTSKICGSGPVTFTNKSLGGSTFIWSLGDGSTSNSSTTFTHTYTQPGTYTVRLIAIDETTCVGRDTAEKTVLIYALPNPQLALDSVVMCLGDTAQLNATYNHNYTYLWSPNQYLTNNTIYNPGAFPPSSQYYKLHIKDDSTLCENTDSILVKVLIPVADTRYENITGCSGQPTIRIKNYSQDFIYKWTFGDGTVFESENQQVTHSYSDFGDYLVTVLVHRGTCSITDTVQVHIPVVKIPNLFTPNGDNLNDKYVIEGMTKNWKLEVYNRWGNAIYTREPYDQSWDGADLNGGIYYFLITDPVGNKCKGWVHIMK